MCHGPATILRQAALAALVGWGERLVVGRQWVIKTLCGQTFCLSIGSPFPYSGRHPKALTLIGQGI